MSKKTQSKTPIFQPQDYEKWQYFHTDNIYFELQHQLKNAGNVFLYTAWRVPNGSEVTPNHHRAIIFQTLLDYQSSERQRTLPSFQEYEEKIANAKSKKERYLWQNMKKSLENYLDFSISVEKARYLELEPKFIANFNQPNFTGADQPIGKNWFYNVFHAFSNPPYSMRVSDEEKRRLWQALADFVGLTEQDKDNIQVFEWVNRHNADWSEFFNDELDWWGVWCLTIYNKKRQSLGCLIASSTD